MGTFSTSNAIGVSDAGAAQQSTGNVVVPSGAIVYVMVVNSDGAPLSPSSVTWDPAGANQALTQLGSTLSISTFGRASLWRIITPTAGTAPVRANWSGNQTERSVFVWVGTGFDTTTPNETPVTATGTDTTPTATASTGIVSGDDVLTFGAYQHAITTARTFNSPSGGTNVNERQDTASSPDGYSGGAVMDAQATGTSISPQWTLSGAVAGWGIFVVPLNSISGPAITVQPGGASAVVGGTATYSVTSPDATTYQWQTSTDGGETWANVSGGSGATTATYTTPATVVADNGRQYRCVLTNANGTTNSVGAWFHVSGIGLTSRGRGTSREPQHLFTVLEPALQNWAQDFRAPSSCGSARFDAFAVAFSDLYFLSPEAGPPPSPPTVREPEDWVWSTRNRPGSGPLSVGQFYVAPRVIITSGALPAARTATASLGAAVQFAHTVASSLQAALQESRTVSGSAGAAVQEARAASAVAGAAVLEARTATAAAGAAVQVALAATAGLSAQVQAGFTASLQLEAAIAASQVATAALGAAVQAAATTTASLSAFVQAGTSAVASLQVAVQEARAATAALQVAVAVQGSATSALGAAIATSGAASASLAAAVRAARSGAVLLGAYIDDPAALVFTADSRARVGAAGDAVRGQRVGAAGEAVARGRVGRPRD